jgi:excisionase family DNA binding protein
MKNPISIAEKDYTVREAAKLLGQKERTTRDWILDRKIVVIRVGKTILIPESEIKRILEDRSRPANEEP